MLMNVHQTTKALAIVGLAASCAVVAQPSGFNEEAVIRAVDDVVAEHRVYATCLALDGAGLSLVQENWRREVARAVEILKDMNPTAKFVLRFSEATALSRLLDGDMRLSAAMDFCHKNEKTTRKFYEFGYTRLPSAIARAAKQAPRK